MNRRTFLKGLGTAAVVAVVPAIILPRTRKIWQVHPNTPLKSKDLQYYPYEGGPIRFISGDTHFGEGKPRMKHFIHDEYVYFPGDHLDLSGGPPVTQEQIDAFMADFPDVMKGPAAPQYALTVSNPIPADDVAALKRAMNTLSPKEFRPVRIEQLPEALKHVGFWPDNIKMWS